MNLPTELKNKLSSLLGKEGFIKTLLAQNFSEKTAEMLWKDYLEFFIQRFVSACYGSLSEDEKKALWEGLDNTNENNSANMIVVLARTEELMNQNPNMFDTGEVLEEIKDGNEELFKVYLEEKYKDAKSTS